VEDIIASQIEDEQTPNMAAPSDRVNGLQASFRQVRALSCQLVSGLSDADATPQSMADASPAKWHLAHSSWFFETFILRDHLADYDLFDADYPFLFNSYYEAEGARHARPERGLITRPSLEEIMAYRAHVDAAVLANIESFSDAVLDLLELGLNHEQQHQELLLTDILHLFSRNPLGPKFCEPVIQESVEAAPLQWIAAPNGIASVGHDRAAPSAGFAFDCEGPAHDVLLQPYAMANRTVTSAEWMQFMAADGYKNSAYWLSDGWTWVAEEGISAPLYWRERDGHLEQFGLDGWRVIDPHAPVCHISLYEADAFASWAATLWPGARLPTEFEWEAFARQFPLEDAHCLTDTGDMRPTALSSPPENSDHMAQPLGLYGHVWEWTGSAYRPYPGFKAAEGAVGEYNGKFMSSQFVLRGGSCATPRGHIRPSYRNFFYPHHRWQFTGLRLAKDL